MKSLICIIVTSLRFDLCCPYIDRGCDRGCRFQQPNDGPRIYTTLLTAQPDQQPGHGGGDAAAGARGSGRSQASNHTGKNHPSLMHLIGKQQTLPKTQNNHHTCE